MTGGPRAAALVPAPARRPSRVVSGVFVRAHSRRGGSRAATAGLLVMVLLACASPALAQHDHDMSSMSSSWKPTFEAQVFLGLNLQERKFRDFHQIESLNWFMASASRGAGGGHVTVHSMFSLEPFTLRKLGTAQVFQTGETYQRLSLVDYQHPHDFVMGATVAYEWPSMGKTRLRLEAGPVGEPALGSEAFMHRASAGPNPTAPLSHHHLDATHISHGVVNAAVTRGGVTFEASAFRGRESDEHRVKMDFGPLDSYSGRVTWKGDRWRTQVSAGHLKFPDPTEFTDIDRLTASVSYAGEFRGRPLDWLFAFGLNRESHLRVTSPAWVTEAAWRASDRHTWYARAELVDQDILTLGGYDPPDFFHPHTLSRLAAFTAGIERAVAVSKAGRFAVGGDATVYATPANLLESYGHPFSVHVFLRYRKN